MSRAKQQGTAYETSIVKRLLERGHRARRLPEGGSLDQGDIEADLYGLRVVIEAKARQTLSLQPVLAGARRKALPAPAMVWWKRITPNANGGPRQPVAGQRELVALDPADLFRLLEAAYAAGQSAGSD